MHFRNDFLSGKNALLTNSVVVLGVFLSLIFGQVAQARLGETEAELVKRFGSPIETQKVTQLDFEQQTYKNRDLLIGVTLIDGKSASEQYLRVTDEKDEKGKPILAPIPNKLAEAILQANAFGSTWEELPQEANKRRFLRSDKEALGLFLETKGFIKEIRISSSEFNRHLSRYTKLAK